MKAYRELIKNKHRVIHLGRLSTYNFDKADLCAFVNRFTTKYPDSDITEQLNEIMCKDCDCWEDVKEEEKNRIQTATELLYSAWKMSYRTGDTYTELSYIFPYKISELNGYIFSLHVPASRGGDTYESLSDTSADINSPSSWGNKDILFEEVDFSEFVDAAKQSCDRAIDDRLKRMVERDNVLKNK